MANIFWSGEKESKEKTIKALTKKVVDIWDGAFHVRFRDGILELVVEHPNDEDTNLWSKFDGPKYMGHEFHILKVPEGYVEHLNKARG